MGKAARAAKASGRPKDDEGPSTETFEGQYRVELPSFEGPLDLLLHLIQQHELDILDIPVSFITEKYLGYLRMMETLTIDLASEYLVMAATLTHIKSKMLLPSVPAGQEDDGLPGQEEDPRAELVRRLLEYQKYKAAAADLGERGTLGRDVFPRGIQEEVPDTPAPFQELGVFSLLDAFDKILRRTNVKVDHEVMFDRISITDRMVELSDRLNERKTMRFEDFFSTGTEPPTRFDLVITFLALLEMAKLRMIRVYQSDPLAPLHVELSAREPDDQPSYIDEQIAQAEAASKEARPEEAPPREAPAVDEAPAPGDVDAEIDEVTDDD